MLLTPSGIEDKVRHYVRQAVALHATADEVAASVGGDRDDALVALNELVARNELRRFERPGEGPIYWS